MCPAFFQIASQVGITRSQAIFVFWGFGDYVTQTASAKGNEAFLSQANSSQHIIYILALRQQRDSSTK